MRLGAVKLAYAAVFYPLLFALCRQFLATGNWRFPELLLRNAYRYKNGLFVRSEVVL